MWGMRRIQFYLLKIGKTPLIKKEEASCFVYVLYKCHLCTYRCLLGSEKVFFFFFLQTRGTNPDFPSPAPRWPDAVTVRQSSPHPTFSPCLLVWCFFFFFSFFFRSPDHTVHTTDSDQRAASKPEQETRAKGSLSLSLSLSLLPPPPLSSFLDTSLQTAQAEPRRWARRCLAWAGP